MTMFAAIWLVVLTMVTVVMGCFYLAGLWVPEALTMIGLMCDILGVSFLFLWAPEKFPDPQTGVSFALQGKDAEKRRHWRELQPTRQRRARHSVGLILVGFVLQLLGELGATDWVSLPDRWAVVGLHELEKTHMETIGQSAAAGIIAALAATIILGIAKCIRQWWARRQDAEFIREILVLGRQRVLEAKDTRHEGMKTTLPADVLRAAQYNHMVKRLGVVLEKWTADLSHNQRKDIFDALDWYHTDSLHAVEKDGKPLFVDLPDGSWPTTEMPLGAARRKFDKLQSIGWLKLRAYRAD